MAAPVGEEKSCAYCGSRDIEAGRLAGFKLKLSAMTTMWASPGPPEIKVHAKSRVSCRSCGEAYTVLAIGGEATRLLLPAVAVHDAALSGFTGLFPGRGWGEVEGSATAAVRPDPDRSEAPAVRPDPRTVHIFFSLGGRRAYLVCAPIAGRYTAVAVAEAGR